MYRTLQLCGLVCNVYTMSRSVLGVDTTQIANFVNYLKNFTVYLSILTLIYGFQVSLATKIGRKM